MNADLWDLEDVGAGPRQVRVYAAVASGPGCPEAFAACPRDLAGRHSVKRRVRRAACGVRWRA